MTARRPVFRYVIVKVADADANLLESKLAAAVVRLGGVLGLARVEPAVVYVRADKGLAVVRVKREGLLLFRAALAAYKEPLARVVKVAGTLRKARAICSSLPGASAELR
jgi:RNase P/RNase MRP subunit POP5